MDKLTISVHKNIEICYAYVDKIKKTYPQLHNHTDCKQTTYSAYMWRKKLCNAVTTIAITHSGKLAKVLTREYIFYDFLLLLWYFKGFGDIWYTTHA